MGPRRTDSLIVLLSFLHFFLSFWFLGEQNFVIEDWGFASRNEPFVPSRNKSDLSVGGGAFRGK